MAGKTVQTPDKAQGLVMEQFILVLSPAAVAQQTTAEQTFSVPAQVSLPANAQVLVSKPTAQAGVGIVGSRRASSTTIGITFANVPAGGNLTPTASELYTVTVIRPA